MSALLEWSGYVCVCLCVSVAPSSSFSITFPYQVAVRISLFYKSIPFLFILFNFVVFTPPLFVFASLSHKSDHPLLSHSSAPFTPSVHFWILSWPAAASQSSQPSVWPTWRYRSVTVCLRLGDISSDLRQNESDLNWENWLFSLEENC